MATRSDIPVAPGALPLVGHAVRLLRDPLGFLSAQRGLAPVVALSLGRRECYLVTDPDAAMQVLVSEQDHFDKGGPFMDAARLLVGNGVITCGNEDHRWQRPMVKPAFHRRQVVGHTDVMRRCAVEAAELWTPGREVDLGEAMYRMAALVVARTLVSAPSGRQAAEVMASALPQLLRGLLRRMLLPMPWMHRVPTPANRRFADACAALDAAIIGVIRQYRRTGEDRHDLLSRIIAGDEVNGRRPDDREVRDQVMSILAAGVETTATLLTWTFHVLARHPAEERRLWSEVDTVLNGRHASFDDLGRLPYAKRVLIEVLRLYPPTWMLSRVAVADTTVADVALPRGAEVVISPYALQRDPAVFPAPDAFDPDRWLPDRATARQKQSFLAFGAGRRRCMGELFGMTEATIALATISGTWRLRPVRPDPLRPLPRFLLVPAVQPMLPQRRHTGVEGPGR
jgi:pentalenene oxygenase